MDETSIVSIICSTALGMLSLVISGLTLLFSIKEKRRNEISNEKQVVATLISNYIAVISTSRLSMLLSRAAVINSGESCADFMKSMEKILVDLDSYTIGILSIKEIKNDKISEKIISLRKTYKKIIHEINDLKGMCSKEKRTDFDEDVMGTWITNISHQIGDVNGVYDEITDKLYSVLNTYIRRMK